MTSIDLNKNNIFITAEIHYWKRGSQIKTHQVIDGLLIHSLRLIMPDANNGSFFVRKVIRQGPSQPVPTP